MKLTVKVLKVVKVLNFPGVRSGRHVAGTGINQRETAALDTSVADSFRQRLMKQVRDPINTAHTAALRHMDVAPCEVPMSTLGWLESRTLAATTVKKGIRL